MIATMENKLGFGMDGLEKGVADVVEQIITRFGDVTYVEIGVGEGRTLATIARDLAARCFSWRAIGIELPEGYSFSYEATERNIKGEGLGVTFVKEFFTTFNPQWNQVTVCLKNSQAFLSENFSPDGEVHLALIDGCHGKACVTMDFLLIEPLIAKGGVVMFHDFGADQIGQHQPHCGYLDVRGACHNLGLLNNERPGWQWQRTLLGDKGRAGADMGVFERKLN